MNRAFAPNLVRPNQPLRKPSSSPLPLSTTSPLPRHLMPGATAMCPPSDAIGQGTLTASTTPSYDKHTCLPYPLFFSFLLRCTDRCKKASYCSVLCQTQDWKTHRGMCKATDPEPANGLTLCFMCFLKHGDTSSLHRVYLKDLHMIKITEGADIQASVVEFYSPGRFFLLAQSPELLKTMQSITTELQKTCSCSSVMTYVPCVGEVCGVQFSTDLNWYRGLVQTLAPDQKIANILYIDFGNEENVPVDRVRPLPANIKPFCPCCRIAGVVPVAGKWSGECCIAVRQLLAHKTMTVRVVESVGNGHLHVVDILLSIGKHLSTFLLEHGYAAKEIVNATPTEQEINAMMCASLENFRRLSNGKDSNTWAQPPEPLTQAVGDSFSVVITHFQSPDEIVVQKVENAGLIQELQLKLREQCCQLPAPPNFRPAPGTVCCAQFSEDKQWYRAKVLAYSSEERVCVGYLDFGNSEEVELGHLRPISTSLLDPPMQAMRCGLAGSISSSWSEDCLLVLQRRVSNRILRVEIQGAYEGKALVAMIDEASDPQANIAELLISAGYAAPVPVHTISDQQVNQMTTAAAQPLVPDPVKEPLLWSCTELSCDGQTVVLLASVIENPGEFYCRVDNATDHQQLIDLRTELKQHCETDVSPFEPKVGEPCCAVFPGDGAWYRAMVKGLSDTQVSVNFVDYGYTMNVEKSHLRSITSRLLALPFQAVCCWLTGVEPLGSEWSSEALLWFQTLVEGEQLSARVLSVTDQGYGVELESRGQDVAAALISEQLAKIPGDSLEKSQITTESAERDQQGVKENDWSVDVFTMKFPSFPVDWKTVELPLNKTFQPYIAAVTSPSLFYVFVPSQVVQQKLQEVMMQVADYCTNNQASLSTAVLSRPASGAACCAQFSADNNWYRAVVLQVSESEISVIYADYGNTEKVPFSRILPIPMHLLQLPFHIIRCTLSGKEHFPAEWPEEVQQMFQTVLLNGVLATVQSFDGSANVLSLTLPIERGGGHLTTMILDALQFQTKSEACPSTPQRADQTGNRTPAASSAAAADCLQSRLIPETQKGKEDTTATSSLTTAPEPTPQTPKQNKNTSAFSGSGGLIFLRFNVVAGLY
uniref:Tudor domain containing 1 n=1 Tax=Mastacembelus armatus TaxID=205130 RepID=A0A7N8XPG8_9TELE